MEWAYFDTSILVKRYVTEPGSVRARGLLRRYQLVSSAIAPVEVISALSRRRDAGELAQAHFEAIIARLRGDRPHWELVEVSPLVLGQAEEWIQRAAVRTLDAIHLASAALFQTAAGRHVPFVTADARQREAASRSALDILWVG